jgi:hypothetical protein
MFVIGLLVACIGMFVANNPRMDVVALRVIVILPLSGILKVPEALAGFSDPNVILIAAMFVIGEGLVRLSNDSTINTDPPTPNLAEAAFHAALGRADGVPGNALEFPPGLHLHWALPDALTTGKHHGGSMQFPAVPNRWQVQQLDNRGQVQKFWIVESDFLHPCDGTGMPTYQTQPEDGHGKPITAWPGDKPITFPTKRLQLSNQMPGAAFRYNGPEPVAAGLATEERRRRHLPETRRQVGLQAYSAWLWGACFRRVLSKLL